MTITRPIPAETLTGICCICGKTIAPSEFADDGVIGAGDPINLVFAHRDHFVLRRKGYEQNLETLCDSICLHFDVAQYCRANGYALVKMFADDRFAAVEPMLMGQSRIIHVLFEKRFIGLSGPHESWMYRSIDDAMKSLWAWDGTSDPPGEWTRHSPSGRRDAGRRPPEND